MKSHDLVSASGILSVAAGWRSRDWRY